MSLPISLPQLGMRYCRHYTSRSTSFIGPFSAHLHVNGSDYLSGNNIYSQSQSQVGHNLGRGQLQLHTSKSDSLIGILRTVVVLKVFFGTNAAMSKYFFYQRGFKKKSSTTQPCSVNHCR